MFVNRLPHDRLSGLMQRSPYCGVSQSAQPREGEHGLRHLVTLGAARVCREIPGAPGDGACEIIEHWCRILGQVEYHCRRTGFFDQSQDRLEHVGFMDGDLLVVDGDEPQPPETFYAVGVNSAGICQAAARAGSSPRMSDTCLPLRHAVSISSMCAIE